MRWSAGRLLFTLVLAAAAGCRAAQDPGPARVAPEAPAEVGGVWSAVVRGTVPPGQSGGDLMVEQQEWHLVQQADAVKGYYLALVSVSSGDGRPFVCNRRTSFSMLWRIAVRGRVQGSAVGLEETAVHIAPGECTASVRALRQWQGRASGDVLELVTGGESNRLNRAPQAAPAEKTALQSRAEAAFAGPPPVPRGETGARPAPGRPGTGRSPGDVSGIWVWEHRGPAANGDDKEEREEWHLQQNGSRIHGYYDRLVRQISTDGQAYRCSMAFEFQIATRFRVVGDVEGDHIILRENGYEILDPSPCDNGVRRLDSYEGDLAEDELRLVFGPGSRQTLRRARPDIPTQRF